jgi:hypothetical protein
VTTVPNSWTQLLVAVVLIVPGFVYQIVRIRLGGRVPADTELWTRVMNAFVGSAIFALGYLFILGSRLVQVGDARSEFEHHPRRAILFVFVGAIAVPALVAVLRRLPEIAGRVKRGELEVQDLAFPSNWTRYDPRPTAWDVAFQQAKVGFVRVRMEDGTWYAGFYGSESWSSSFPDPPSLFLELEYRVEDDGTIGDLVEGSAGSVIVCTHAVLVELIEPPTQPATSTPLPSPADAGATSPADRA